jgi:hypothetical protein
MVSPVPSNSTGAVGSSPRIASFAQGSGRHRRGVVGQHRHGGKIAARHDRGIHRQVLAGCKAQGKPGAVSAVRHIVDPQHVIVS